MKTQEPCQTTPLLRVALFTVTQRSDDGDICPFTLVYRTLGAAKDAVAELLEAEAEYLGEERGLYEWSPAASDRWEAWADSYTFVIQRVTVAE